MQPQFIDLVEDFEEVLEKDVCLLAVQDVVIADDSPRLHAKLRLGQDQKRLTRLLILVNS